MFANIALILSLLSSLSGTILHLLTEQENTCVADHSLHLGLRKPKKEFL